MRALELSVNIEVSDVLKACAGAGAGTSRPGVSSVPDLNFLLDLKGMMLMC